MKRLLDILYPRRCIGCGVSAPETFRYICWDCWSDSARVESPFCDLCGDPVSGLVEDSYVCSWCRRHGPWFNMARSEESSRRAEMSYQ